jgi:hypothetical protein
MVLDRPSCREWVLKKWRLLAQAWNLAILLGLFTLFAVHAHMVSSNIAHFESQGLVVGNDLGQRGLALSAISVLVTSGLAILSIWYLFRASVLGFVLHAVLWFALLLLVMSTWLVFARELGGVEIALLLLCLAGTGYGVMCARADARLQKDGAVTP